MARLANNEGRREKVSFGTVGVSGCTPQSQFLASRDSRLKRAECLYYRPPRCGRLDNISACGRSLGT